MLTVFAIVTDTVVFVISPLCCCRYLYRWQILSKPLKR